MGVFILPLALEKSNYAGKDIDFYLHHSSAKRRQYDIP
jgi:hypothetical protein